MMYDSNGLKNSRRERFVSVLFRLGLAQDQEYRQKMKEKADRVRRNRKKENK